MRLIVFVCRGNTCRSPMAQAVAERALIVAGLERTVRVASAGVSVEAAGAPADPRAISVAERSLLDLQAHRATALTAEIASRAHLLVALDTRTRDDILARFGVAPEHVPLLMSFAPGSGLIDVADPYCGTEADYMRAFDLIRAGVDGLVTTLAAAPHARS